MKNLILIFFLFIGFAKGADEKYMKAMEKNVAMLDTASGVAMLQAINNSFERIGNANPDEWLPLYYQSYCHLMMGMRQKETSAMDRYYDRAEELIERADSMKPDNSEIYVMKSFIKSLMISVNPAVRGPVLGIQSSILNNKALELDDTNPRGYLIKGTGLMYRPAQFGGGKDKALPVLEEAVERFAKFKPSSPIMPHWGEARAKEMLEQCKKMD